MNINTIQARKTIRTYHIKEKTRKPTHSRAQWQPIYSSYLKLQSVRRLERLKRNSRGKDLLCLWKTVYSKAK